MKDKRLHASVQIERLRPAVATMNREQAHLTSRV
jgi:hypothetical protein